MTWIRWECSTPHSDVVGQLAEALNIPLAQALGHYTAACCGFGEHRDDGSVDAVSDATLEQWAMWAGRRGRFAEAFRLRCRNDEGYLRGWWRQEKLFAKRERDRVKRKTRKGSARNPQQTLDPTVTVTNDTTCSDGASAPPPPSWPADVAEALSLVGPVQPGRAGKALAAFARTNPHVQTHGVGLLRLAAAAYAKHVTGLSREKVSYVKHPADFFARAGYWVDQVRPGGAAELVERST